MDKQEYEIVLTVQSKKGKKPEIWLDDNFDVRGSGIDILYATDVRAINKHTSEYKWIRDMEESFMTKRS
tara:strand:- start:136 stop:342 length:207 start_codon:yes stop_codon:yes gene_type:complete